MTTISMDTNIYGMAVRGRTIYYCTKDKGIKMLNLSDKSVSDIINSNMVRKITYDIYVPISVYRNTNWTP
jgi:hypothetical protein